MRRGKIALSLSIIYFVFTIVAPFTGENFVNAKGIEYVNFSEYAAQDLFADANETEDAESKSESTNSSQNSTDSEKQASNTYANYYAQGYANALMSLTTSVNSSNESAKHIAYITENSGKKMTFSFYGDEDFVDSFGATKQFVFMAGEDNAYVCTAKKVYLQVQGKDTSLISGFLSTTQYLSGDAKILASDDKLSTSIIAPITDTYKNIDYKGYACLLTKDSDGSGIYVTYTMPASNYDDSKAQKFVYSLELVDESFSDIVQDYTAVSDDYNIVNSITLMCDTGFFNYKSLDSENFDAAQNLVKPALVELFHADSEDSKTGWSGSGVICDIESDYIYILSVEHVAELMTEGNNEIWLYDKTRLTFNSKIDYVRLSDENEICMFRIPTSMIPTRILVGLREVDADENIYEELSTGDQLLGVCTNLRHTGKDYTAAMTLLKLNDAIPEEPDDTVYLSATLALEQGMSGTAVIDMHGNFVGIADSRNVSTEKSYVLMINGLSSLKFD